MTGTNPAVLVVDDNRMNRLKLTRAVAAGGFDVFEAAGGAEALDLLRSRRYHLVLLDLVMPEVDGQQVLAEMQGDRDLAGIPVIVVSAVEDDAEVQRCLDLGAVDFLAKTALPEEVLRRVRDRLPTVA